MNKILNFFKTDKVLKTLLFIGLSIFIFTIIFILVYLFYFNQKLTDKEIGFFIGTTKDVFQILFFILVGLVTLLSYCQAKRTLFTPIKTETFKMQIKSFEEILAFFQSKSEVDFIHLFDSRLILEANFQLLFIDYTKHFFKDEIEIDVEIIKEIEKNFNGAIVTKTWFEKNYISPEYFDKKKPKIQEDVKKPALILEKWKNYEYGQIKYTKKYSQEIENLEKLIASPLIPNALKTKMEEFDLIVYENLRLVGDVLNEIAQELPNNFPTTESTKKLELLGVWNEYNKKKEDLEPKAKEILNYIREYLKIDKLIE